MSSSPPNKRVPVLVNLSNNEQHQLIGTSIKLGRAPDNQIILDDDGYASAEHARIFWDQGWWLEDLMSSNGTRLNDELVTQPSKLSPGDLIKAGRTTFRID